MTEGQVKAAVLAALENSSAVFSGEVVEVTPLKVIIKTESVWKGEKQDTIILSTGQTKVAENIYSGNLCTYGFGKGRRYVVFARTSSFGLEASEMYN